MDAFYKFHEPFNQSVQIQAILFVKSMSERVGSDIERLCNLISKSTQNLLKMMISKIKFLGSRIPLIYPNKSVSLKSADDETLPL